MDELETFKTAINLTAYAAGQGYQLDRKESSRSSVVMRHPDGDKIIIARNQSGHWVYFSVKDEADNGSIVDFIQNRTGQNLGQVRQALRAWRGNGLPVTSYAPQIERSHKDRGRIVATYQRMQILTRSHAYLEERGIPGAILTNPRFADRIRTDSRGNTVFPHFDKAGLCGYEIKNRGFTGFSPGGEKGLWFSQVKKSDNCLVIAESAIDALSYAALFPDKGTRYASIGGKLNPHQPELLQRAAEKMPSHSDIVIATDADPAGEELAQQIGNLVQETGRRDLALVRARPPLENSDWNDQLQAQKPIQKSSFPIARF